jgi:hypothetical protein
LLVFLYFEIGNDFTMLNTNGTLLIGNGLTGSASVGTIIAGSGISIDYSAGNITISNAGSGGTVTSVDVTVPSSILSVSGGPITMTGMFVCLCVCVFFDFVYQVHSLLLWLINWQIPCLQHLMV